jgi:mRNA interferase MazF
MPSDKPVRGEIWDVDFEPVIGHEQGGRRPALVVSVNEFNRGPSGLVIVVPISTKDKRVRSQVPIPAGEGGLRDVSFAKCEAVRSVSLERLRRRWGTVTEETVEKVGFCLRILMGL